MCKVRERSKKDSEKEVKLLLFDNDMILHTKNLKESHQASVRINKCSEISGQKTNVHIHTNTQTSLVGQTVQHTKLNCQIQYLHPVLEPWFEFWLPYFCSSFLLICLGRQWKMFQVLPMWEAECFSWLLPSDQQMGRSLHLSSCFCVCHSLLQINSY